MHRSFLKRFPLFIWLLFAVSSVSSFHPDTGGQRRSLIEVRWFSSVLLRGGRGLQADVAVCGEHSLCSGHTGFAPYGGVCAFPVYPAQAPGCSIWSGPCVDAVPVFGSSTKARIRLRLRFVPSPASAVQAARGVGALSPMRRAVSLAPARAAGRVPAACFCLEELASSRDPPRRRILRKSLDRTRGLFAGWEGVASLGLSLPLSPPPASYLQRGRGGSSLEFLSPLVLRTAGGVFGLVNFSSLSHSLKELPPTALRAFGPVLTLSNAARSSPFRPYLLVAGAGVWSTLMLGVAFRHVICGPYLIFPPS